MSQFRVRIEIGANGTIRIFTDNDASLGVVGQSWDVGDWCRWFETQAFAKTTLVVNGLGFTNAATRWSSSAWAKAVVALVYALEGARLSDVEVEFVQRDEIMQTPGSFDMDATPPEALDQVGSYVCMCLASLFCAYSGLP